MWTRVDIDVRGDRQASRYFEVYAHEIDDMSVPLRETGERLIDSVEQQLDTEGVAGLGRPFRPLEPAYALWKSAHFPGQRILERLGVMRRHLLDKTLALRVGRHRAVYEPLSEIAGFHQSGTRFMAARPPVKLNDAQRHYAVDQVFAEWLNALRRAPWGGAAS